jgi:hypothetical protein
MLTSLGAYSLSGEPVELRLLEKPLNVNRSSTLFFTPSTLLDPPESPPGGRIISATVLDN